MKKTAFQLNNNELILKILNMIDRSLQRNIDQKVLVFRWNQLLPKMAIRAVFSQYYCAECACLIIDKRELKRHMMLKHRNDVITQHRRRNAEENEDEQQPTDLQF